MSEQTGAAPEGNVPTPATSTSTSSSEDKQDKVSSDQVTTERTMPVNDPPVMGTSTQMPPLVVKQIGVQKPGVTPTAGSVSFDYSGPPVKVTNSTVLDLVNQFGIQNAWSAVLKLRGHNVTKEGGESILPIKRFRERVRKLKQTAETLKSRSDDSTTFLSKEFVTASNMSAESGQDVRNGPKGYSTTDAVIESILKQAVSENDSAQSGGPSTVSASDSKTKRGRKKGKADAGSKSASAAGTSHQGRATSATIDDVVSSVVNKIRNNEPFDADLNVNIPQASPPQQPQVVYASHIPGQTYVMIHDDQMIPVVPQPIAQAPTASAKPSRSKKKNKAAQQAQTPQVVQYSNYIPQPQAGSAIRTTTSGNVPQHVTVVTVPRGQQGAAAPANYVVPSGYTTANGNQPLIFSSNIDFIRNQASPGGQIAKVVAYQPGVQFSQPFVASASPQGISPTTAYQAGPAHAPGQYVLQSAPAPPQQAKPAPPSATAAADDDDDKKKTPRRKSIKAKRDSMFMENFNESDFEELATPKRKESIKKVSKKKEAKVIEKKTAKAAEKPPKKAAKEVAKEKEKKKPVKKRKPSPVSVSEEEDADESDAGSSIIENKGNKGDEVAQLKRQLQAERSRHYTQKRRATKLDDDYKRVLDRLQQTELNLALQMSECERLQGEMKKLRTENDDLLTQLETGGVVKSSNKPAKGAPKKTAPKRKVESPSPPPPPTPTKKAPAKKAAPAKAPVNNKKRGRPAAPSPDAGEATPSAPAESKPTFNLDDLIPRRAAASKRIRYF